MSNYISFLIGGLLLLASGCSSEGKGAPKEILDDIPTEGYDVKSNLPDEINPSNAAFLVVSKQTMTIAVYDYKSRLLDAYPIACGRGIGNKEKPGDMKTPEGVFSVQQIQDASTWTHDFKDGKGVIKGAYGSHFIRLYTPGHSGIGIHGTHNPNSIGTRATEGCIRLNNKDLWDLIKVKQYVYVGMPVIITTSEKDAKVPCVLPKAAKVSPKLTVVADGSPKHISKPEKKAKAEKEKQNVASEKPVKHIVKEGESLSIIADKYNVSVKELKHKNSKLDFDDKIKAGDVIYIK